MTMQKYIKTTMFTNDAKWLATHGIDCWDTICAYAPREPFLPREIIPSWREWRASRSLDYTLAREIRLVLLNVCAEWDTYDDQSMRPVKQIGRAFLMS